MIRRILSIGLICFAMSSCIPMKDAGTSDKYVIKGIEDIKELIEDLKEYKENNEFYTDNGTRDIFWSYGKKLYVNLSEGQYDTSRFVKPLYNNSTEYYLYFEIYRPGIKAFWLVPDFEGDSHRPDGIVIYFSGQTERDKYRYRSYRQYIDSNGNEWLFFRYSDGYIRAMSEELKATQQKK